MWKTLSYETTPWSIASHAPMASQIWSQINRSQKSRQHSGSTPTLRLDKPVLARDTHNSKTQYMTAMPGTGGSLAKKQKNVPEWQFCKKTACSSCSTIVGGDWRLAVGGWRLVVGGGWWWLAAVGSSWRLAVSRRWRLAAGGQLAVSGPLGRSLSNVSHGRKSHQNKQHGVAMCSTICTITAMTESLLPSTSASQTPNPAFRTTKSSGPKKVS